jgi:preprotein translocase subunit SecG
MLTFLMIVLIIAAVFLVLIILAQNPKGGGLSSTFGGTNQIIGARQTTDFMEKATWYTAIGILAVVLITNFFTPNQILEQEKESIFQEQIEDMSVPPPTPGQENTEVPPAGGE